MGFWDALFAFIQFVMVLSVWSYLYKDNIFSRIAAQIVISISTIHFFMWNLKQVYNMGIVTIYTHGRILNIIPIILGILIYLRISKKYSWISTYSYAVMLGLGTGAVLTTLIATSITGLIASTINTAFSGATTFERVSGIILFVGVILGMTHWLFTREAKGIMGYAMKIGRLFLMASIGILYAEDVLWSQSLFVGAAEMVLKFIRGVLLGQTV
jgi:hypothetical protein